MKNFLQAMLILVTLSVPQILVAGGSSGTTGHILDLGHDQLMLRFVESHEFQDALGAINSDLLLRVESNATSKITASDVFRPQGLDIRNGLPLVRSIDSAGEEVFLLNRDLAEIKIQSSEEGLTLTGESLNAAMGGHSGTTGAIEGYLKYLYGIDATGISPESYKFIHDMIGHGTLNGTINIENRVQFAPHQVIEVDGFKLIEGMDSSGNYRYLVEDTEN